jgi:hypothetical protein
MRPLIIEEKISEGIAGLVAHAEKNPFSVDELLDIYNLEGAIPGTMEDFTLYIPCGYRIVFTIEEQPAGRIRHLSVSVDKEGKLPNVNAVLLIMGEIGFKKPLDECKVSIETITDNYQAINVQEVI